MNEHESVQVRAGEPAHRTAILEALRAEVPGFEITGRNVELAGPDGDEVEAFLRADWIGKDRTGRRVLVGLCEDGDDETILWSVEAVAAAGRMPRAGTQGRAQSKHSSSAMQDPALVVVIVRACSARLLAALALLPEESLALLELVSRAGAGRSKPTLARRHPRAELFGSDAAPTGIDAWPASARELAESMSERMARIDPSIERTDTDLGLSFHFRGDEAAMLALSGGRLVGACGTESELGAIEDETDAEAWLERALRAHCGRLLSGSRPPRPLDLLTRSGPLLTAEELAAFRD
jgi:hypothetical protein